MVSPARTHGWGTRTRWEPWARLDRGAVRLAIGTTHSIPARFEGGHSEEEKMAAVHYLRFDMSDEALAIIADPRQPVRVSVDHPACTPRRSCPPPLRAELLKDLGAALS